ncbi:MAG: hypothetical protein ACJ76H_03055 [Bacteriovoracaceae bacterium]
MNFTFLALFFLTSCATYKFNRSALKNDSIAFIPHADYVTYEVEYAPVKKVFDKLVKDVGELKTRGEAHITVITPPEFNDTLKKKITIDELNALALREKIQSSRYEPVCVGRGFAGELKTYYIVVSSPDLLNIRKKVQELYVKKGGAARDFSPEKYYPHITLGFTDRDLHESDGVAKSERTCLQDGQISVQ